MSETAQNDMVTTGACSCSSRRQVAAIDASEALAAIALLVLRYTGKRDISIPLKTELGSQKRTWVINNETRLVDLLAENDGITLKEATSDSENLLAIWNPLYNNSSDRFLRSSVESETAVFNGTAAIDLEFYQSNSSPNTFQVFSTKSDYDERYLDQILSHWIHCIQLLRTKPEAKVITQSVLTESEYDEMIVKWNNNDKPKVEGRFGFEDFEDHAQKSPESIAVSYGSSRLTYGDLQIQANQMAHFLQSIGIGPEIVVGIYLTRSVEFVISLVALRKSGGAFLPLDPDHPEERKHYLINDSKAPFIITSNECKDSLPKGDYHLIVIEDIVSELSKFPTHTPKHGLQDGSMGQLFYTSGSTGKPKGVIMTVFYKEDKPPPEENTKGVKVLLKSSTGFTLILLETFSPLQTGGEIVIVPKDKDQDTRYLIENIKNLKIQTLNLVPSMLSLLLLQDDIGECDSLQKVFTVGERLPVSVQHDFFKKLPNAELYVFYGCTEAPAATFRRVLPDEKYGDRVILGKPMVNKRIYILDEYRAPVPKGVPGEIFIGGAISRGYIHNEKLTRERFLPNPFISDPDEKIYQTGDLGRFMEDGSIEYLGRTDFQVQVMGIRIELGEIEARLTAHPMVNDAIIIAHTSSSGNTLLIAYYTLQGSTYPDTDNLRNHLRNSLPDYMIPARFIPLKEFPLNTSGKIDRLNFPHPESVTVSINGNPVFEAYSTTQTAIRRIFYDALGTSQLLNSDNFFDIGGNSLAAVIVTNELKREFGIQLNITDLYEHSSVFALEKLVENSGYHSPFNLLVKVRTGVGRQNLFMFTVNVSVNAHVSRDFDIYVLRGLWFNENFDFSSPLSAIVENYVKEVLMIQNSGPFYLAGFSMGGTIAHQVACRLQSLGHEVRGLYLADPSVRLPDTDKVPRSNLAALFQHLKHRGLSEGPGIIYSYLLNLFKIPILPKHRDRIAFVYTKTLVCSSTFETFDGKVNLYHRKGYDQLSSWNEIVNGELVTRELETTDHHEVDRTPIQKIWCEDIRP
jgi:amino acid adenylation domain-containing protein